MAKQILFFQKNKADYEKSWVSATATESNSIISNVLDRSNRTGWLTSGSVDANNTQFVINFGDTVTIDTILLINHNFKNFLVEYYNPTSSSWVTLQNVTNSTDTTTYLSFNAVLTTNVRVTIFGTQVANSDKVLTQFIATAKIGQLQGWPVIEKPQLARNLTEQPMLSGKSFIFPQVGMYSASLTVKHLSSSADLGLIESLVNASEGFLYWPCGGDQTQFRSVRQGYRLQDIYLVRCRNEWSPELVEGIYQNGMQVQLDLVEVIT